MYAVDTSVHAAGPMPPASAAVDYIGQDLPAPGVPTASYLRSFRPSEQTASSGYPSTDAPLSAQLAEHMQPGHPDERRGRQTLQATSRDLEAQTEVRRNSLLPVAFAATNAPERTRGGLNGYDTPRPAYTRRNMFSRAFDQVIGQSLGIKAMQPSPIASRGLEQPDDAAGALPVANSARGDRKAGIGSQPNTYRILPRPWDENLVTGTPGDASFAASAAQQRNGWRAR
jgi:hypothetical protein